MTEATAWLIAILSSADTCWAAMAFKRGDMAISAKRWRLERKGVW